MLILSTLIVQAAGLGVAPATLKFENALKGATTEKQLIVQNPGDEAIFFSVTIEGEIEDWIKLSPEGKIELGAENEKKVTIMLTPPADEPNGEYESKILIRTVSDSDIQGSGVGVLPGIDAELIATITDEEMIAGNVDSILTKDEEKDNPIIFRISFGNIGNVPAEPNVKIEIKKKGEVIDTVEERLEEVKAGKSKTYEVEWDTDDQEPNVYYTAKVDISLDGILLESKDNLGFRITGEIDDEPDDEPNDQDDNNTGNPKTLDDVDSPLAGLFIMFIIIIVGLVIYLGLVKKRG